MPTLSELAPLLNVPDVAASTEYYQRKLGFDVLMVANMPGLPDYGIMQRDGFTLHLMQAKDQPVDDVRPGFVCSVDDVDALFKEFRSNSAFAEGFPREHDAIREHGPEDKEYGRRDMIFINPDGHILVFGQDLGGV